MSEAIGTMQVQTALHGKPWQFVIVGIPRGEAMPSPRKRPQVLAWRS